MSRLLAVLLAFVLVVAFQDASAKRLGGGLSFGKSMGRLAPGHMLLADQTASLTTSSPGPVSTESSGQRPAGGVLRGLTAGLGLAWLASKLGMGEGLAPILLLVVFALILVVAFRLFARRAAAVPDAAGHGAGYQTPLKSGEATVPRTYSPLNVGNDASARPWESAGVDASIIGSSVSASPFRGVPEGFDAPGFLKASKTHFVDLQEAWDRSDIERLKAMMTDGMLEQIRNQLAERERAVPGKPNKTDVVMLEARLLGVEEQDTAYMASVEFSGVIREDASSGPNPFREIWSITRPKTGEGGWLVAGVQALQ